MAGRLTFCAWIAFVNSAPVLAVQDAGQFTIAVDVDLVVFNVTVTDDDGHVVSGLTREDFRLLDEGVPQDLALFQPADAPATVGLIVDSSGSMREKRADVAAAALAFANASHPDDEFFVAMFNENVFLSPPDPTRFVEDPTELRAVLLGTPADGMTALYDALRVGIDHLSIGRRDKRALVVLSDGGDNASRESLAGVLESARRSTASIYTIGIYDEYNQDRNPGVLRELAEVTGGKAYFPESPAGLVRVWQEIAAGIRAQYTLGYYSTNPDEGTPDGGTPDEGIFRSVRISASRDGESLRVQSREGYLAPRRAD